MIFLILLLVIPFFIGYFCILFKIGAVHDFTIDFYYWLQERRKGILSAKGTLAQISAFTIEPIFSLLIAINDWTENIENKGTKAGVRVAAYLYLIGTLLFIFFTLGQFIFLLALIGIGILIGSVMVKYIQAKQKIATVKPVQMKTQAKQVEPPTQTFVESIWPHFRSKMTKYRVERLFELKEIEVDYQGDIFSSDITTFPVKTKIGRVDKSGGIYDTREAIPQKIGSIDPLGNITDERFFNNDDLSH
jgi:hypothetical protein